MDIDPSQCDVEQSPKNKTEDAQLHLRPTFCSGAFPVLLMLPASTFSTPTIDSGDADADEEAAAAAAAGWFSYTVEIRMLSCIDRWTHQFSHFLHPLWTPPPPPLAAYLTNPNSDDSACSRLHQFSLLCHCNHISSPLSPVLFGQWRSVVQLKCQVNADR